MELLERKFYRKTESGDIEVDQLQEADYMICKQLMTREEAEKAFPLHEFNTHKFVDCVRCNDNGCPACDTANRGSKYNPEPY